ncbi:hypothetical protein BH11CYA1_BH11CYA1_07000 [soil metagenome]
MSGYFLREKVQFTTPSPASQATTVGSQSAASPQ